MNLGKILCLVSVLGLGATASAQPHGHRSDGPAGRHGRPPGGHPIIRAIDADKNGVVSAAELAGASAAILSLDTNGDGTVSSSELHPARPRGTPPPGAADHPAKGDRPPRPADPVMLALDANADHQLSAGEVANATASLKALDANADGELTRDELRPLPAEKD